MIHLDVRSWHSHLAGASHPEKLAAAAAFYNHGYLALTDWQTTAGLVQHAVACRRVGIKPILGTTLNVAGKPLVILTTDRESFGNMTDLLTLAHRDRENPHLTLEQLEKENEEGKLEGLVCLTGDRFGFTMSAIRAGSYQVAHNFVESLQRLFPDRLYLEQVHHLQPGDNRMLRLLDELSEKTGVPTVATNAVRHATKDDYALYDALTCARLGINVCQHHLERPVNNQGYLCCRSRLAKLPFTMEALARGYEVAERCSGVNILAEKLLPPEAHLPPGMSADEFLAVLCREALPIRYVTRSYSYLEAEKRLKRELDIIRDKENAEFFLVVREVVDFARTHGIRCSGRGSAANSIVAYLLRITHADPIKHRLIFERFLRGSEKETPDIDVDFDSSRREHIIKWLNVRFKETHTAMTANIITFQLKLAVREMMKVLGFPEPSLAIAAKVLPHWSHEKFEVFHNEVAKALSIPPDAVLLQTLCQLVNRMDAGRLENGIPLGKCPRHLSLHSGGMVLSRSSLRYFTAIRTSANGTRQVEFNKEDVEELGIVKLDVLGLRMLSSLSEAVERLDLDCNVQLDLESLPDHDEPTYEMIRSSKTLGVFQIESPGQMRLIAETQPLAFRDLVVQVALFRPGPLQGNMVSPYVAHRQAGHIATYAHPSLEPVLRDTYGLVIFQEQVLEIVHQFAGITLERADTFRRLMSKYRIKDEMEGMRGEFVGSAVRYHANTEFPVSEEVADQVFNTIAPFVGYGFCRSHAVAFANIVYQSAYLKTHHPAAHFCGVLEHHPGFYPTQTLLQEARRCGVAVLPADVRFSDLQYRLERLPGDGDDRYGIRLPFKAIKGMSENGASELVWQRFEKPFDSLEDMYRRVPLASDEWDALARVGALTAFEGRRGALWEVGMLRRRFQQERAGQQVLDIPLTSREEIPDLPALPPLTKTAWDYELQEITTGVHPVSHHRVYLEKLKVRSLGELLEIPAGRQVRTAGVVIARQKPPTAKGFCFVELEDETGMMQVALPPWVYQRYARVVRESGLVVEGKLEGTGEHRSVLAHRIFSMQQILKGPHLGGYSGFPGQMAH